MKTRPRAAMMICSRRETKLRHRLRAKVRVRFTTAEKLNLDTQDPQEVDLGVTRQALCGRVEEDGSTENEAFLVRKKAPSAART